MSRSGWHARLLHSALAYRRGLATGAALIVARALVTVALPWPMKLAVDYVLVDRPLPTWAGWLDQVPAADTSLGLLLVLGFAVVGLAIVSGTLDVARRVWRRSLGVRMSNDLAHDALQVVQRRSPIAPEALRSGDLVRRIVSDTKCIDTLVFGVWVTVFQSLVTFGLLALVMVAMSPSLAVVAALIAIPMLLVVRSHRDRMESDATQLADAQADVMTGAEQMLSTLPEIQAFGAEGAELRRFTGDADRQLRETVRSQRTSVRFQVSIGSVTAVGTGAVMLVGGLLVLDGVLTVGGLLVFLSYLTALYGPVEGLAYVAQALATAKAGAQRLLALSAPDAEVAEPPDPVELPEARRGAAITFDHVTFGYRADTPVLTDVSLHIAEGETIAIVGRTGAGKSSLISLVARFFDPWSGSVRIEGVDLRDARLRDVRRRVALVRQDPLLLPVSIRENIAYGTPDAADWQIEQAADQALASEFIDELPEGLDTIVGERGVTLSGGQRQRLAIARALCRDAPILILDEPTAALDAESEAELLRVVRQAATGRTILMIAHRISTVRWADRILVLQGARIAEDGSHDVLVQAGGLYADYLTMQATAGDEREPSPTALHDPRGVS